MNIALLCVLIIITSETDGFHVENARISHKKETEQRILLRKLQNFQRDDPKEMKTVTWNQILADALVNRIKIFSFNKEAETKLSNDIEIKSNFITNCISEMMYLYKLLIYDRYNKHIDSTTEHYDVDTELTKGDKEEQTHNASDEVVKKEKGFEDPKDEVEIVEPRYHGKLCDNCGGSSEKDSENGATEIVEITEKVKTSETGCPDGLVASDGSCSDPKSKFILSIPYQCPIGYRPDWLGYCRPRL